MDNKNPFAEFAQQYLDKGYSVIPVDYGTKKPSNKWAEFQEQLATPEQIKEWSQTQHNIAICTGRVSGVIGLDFDNDIDGLHAKVLEILPDSPVKKVGAKGFTAFYQYNGESTRKLSKNGQAVVEILSDRHSCVLPPSLHPDTGKNYWWVGASLLDIDKSDLPIITDKMLAEFQALFYVPIPKREYSEPLTFDEPTEQEIRDALYCIPADLDRETWLYIGMGLHDFSGGATWAEQLFYDWSHGGTKFKEKDHPTIWQSFKANGGRTIATLFGIARDYGYTKSNNNSKGV